jgi:hypothetical protein
MKKVKASKARKSGTTRVPVSKKTLKPVDLGAIRERITNLVGDRAVAMVETTMDEVDKGHYLAMKYLFEMVGLCPATSAEETTQGDSLAKTLLRRLQLSEEAEAATEVTKDCTADAVEPDGDAVK